MLQVHRPSGFRDMELQHILGQPQTYPVSPIWNSSGVDSRFSSCPDALQPIRSVAAMMAITNFIKNLPDDGLDPARSCFGPVDGSKDFRALKPPLS